MQTRKAHESSAEPRISSQESETQPRHESRTAPEAAGVKKTVARRLRF